METIVNGIINNLRPNTVFLVWEIDPLSHHHHIRRELRMVFEKHEDAERYIHHQMLDYILDKDLDIAYRTVTTREEVSPFYQELDQYLRQHGFRVDQNPQEISNFIDNNFDYDQKIEFVKGYLEVIKDRNMNPYIIEEWPIN